MSDPVTRFLGPLGWAGARRDPLAEDASARAYTRLTRGADTAVLMRAPPEECSSFEQFLRMADWLRAQTLSAPEVFAADVDAGLMLLEDFGHAVMARLADAGEGAEPYRATTDALAVLAQAAPPDWVPRLGADELVAQTALAFEEMPGTAITFDDWSAVLGQCLRVLPPARHVALRDLHAENVIWLPERSGVSRVGLLDFQDAVMAPHGYDLASLVDDPRRLVPADLRAELIARHALALGMPAEDLTQTVGLVSLARNTRILGIFRRVARLRDRPAYLGFLPRTAELIRAASETPEAQCVREPVETLLEAYGLTEDAPA